MAGAGSLPPEPPVDLDELRRDLDTLQRRFTTLRQQQGQREERLLRRIEQEEERLLALQTEVHRLPQVPTDVVDSRALAALQQDLLALIGRTEDRFPKNQLVDVEEKHVHYISRHRSQNTWRVFYSDSAGNITELALGADGTFLQSEGASSAPTFGALVVGDVPFDDATSDPLATAAAAADGTEGSPARKDHVHPYHADHGVTHNAVHGISKHTEHATWKALYTDGSGDEQELALGAAGTVFESTGTAAAPKMGVNERGVAITVEDPTASEDISIRRYDAAFTIKEMHAVVRGTSPSVTWTIRHQPAGTGNGRADTGNEVVTGGTTTTSTTAGDDVTSFNDATVAADSFLWLETTAKSGTVDELHITIRWEFD